MAGRLAWIIAGGAAVIGGMAIQDGDMFSFADDRQIDRQVDREVDQEVDEAIAEAREGRRIVVDGRPASDQQAVRAMTDAVADLVKAEAALAASQIGDNDDPAEVAAARAQRDRARAEIERLKAELEARSAARAVDDGSQAARDAIREQVRSQVRTEVREAVRNN